MISLTVCPWTCYQYFVNSIDNLRYYSQTVNGKTKVPRYDVDEGFGELVGSHLLVVVHSENIVNILQIASMK